MRHEATHQNQGPRSLVLVGPRVDLQRVASSRLLESPFAYIYCRVWPKRKEIGIQARFSIFQCSVGVLLLLFYIFFSFQIMYQAKRFRERQREIDVIDGDNLCKDISFLLHCNLLHLLHDIQLISSSHGNLTTNHLTIYPLI